MKNAAIIKKCKTWVERFVIGLQLCPFAKQPFEQGRVKFTVCESGEMEKQLHCLWQEVEHLLDTKLKELSNTLLIFPSGLNDFDDYLDLFQLAEELLAQQQKDTEIQLASFHPDYQFEGTEKDDVSNYTNRSPFPMIHLLRISEVANAIEHYPEIEKVPEKNIQKLKQLGRKGIQELTGDI